MVLAMAGVPDAWAGLAPSRLATPVGSDRASVRQAAITGRPGRRPALLSGKRFAGVAREVPGVGRIRRASWRAGGDRRGRGRSDRGMGASGNGQAVNGSRMKAGRQWRDAARDGWCGTRTRMAVSVRFRAAVCILMRRPGLPARTHHDEERSIDLGLPSVNGPTAPATRPGLDGSCFMAGVAAAGATAAASGRQPGRAGWRARQATKR